MVNEPITGTPTGTAFKVRGRMAQIIAHMLTDPTARYFGAQLRTDLNVPSISTVYRVLRLMEETGWVTAQLEDPGLWEPVGARNLRNYYTLTEKGVLEAARRLQTDAL